MVILVGTTVKMVMLRKVIAGEKSSASFVYHFCFGKSMSIQYLKQYQANLNFLSLLGEKADRVGNGSKAPCILSGNSLMQSSFELKA